MGYLNVFFPNISNINAVKIFTSIFHNKDFFGEELHIAGAGIFKRKFSKSIPNKLGTGRVAPFISPVSTINSLSAFFCAIIFRLLFLAPSVNANDISIISINTGKNALDIILHNLVFLKLYDVIFIQEDSLTEDVLEKMINNSNAKSNGGIITLIKKRFAKSITNASIDKKSTKQGDKERFFTDLHEKINITAEKFQNASSGVNISLKSIRKSLRINLTLTHQKQSTH